MIRALPNVSEHLNHVKLILTHSEHLKTIAEIQSHLEMEEERLKMFGTPYMALLPKEIGPGRIGTIEVGSLRKVHAPLRKVGQRLGLPRSKRPKAMERKI